MSPDTQPAPGQDGDSRELTSFLEPLASTDDLEMALSRLRAAHTDGLEQLVRTALAGIERRVAKLEEAPRSLPHGRAVQRSLGLEVHTQPSGPTVQQVIPRLPAKLTRTSLVKLLQDQLFTVQDFRDKGGSLWVKYTPEFKPFAEALNARGVAVRLKTERKQYEGRWYLIDEYGVLE